MPSTGPETPASGSSGVSGPGDRLVSLLFVSAQISRADVARVARLARLNLSDADLDRYTGQLAGVLEHFSDIDSLDLASVEPFTQPYPLVNVLRADVEAPTLDRAEVLAEAPAAEQDRFRVPPILGLEQ